MELLNEVLDLSRMEAGKFQLDSMPFSLRGTLDQTLKMLEIRANEKSLKLIRDLPDDIHDALVGDPQRLRQILMNLIGNAIKFTARGEVAVRVRVASVETAGKGDLVLEFAVEDTGIGISAENQRRIFAPFTQADASIARNFGGTGLGLTIAKNLIEMMGGTIRVESQLGKGSKFICTARFGTRVGQTASSELIYTEPSSFCSPSPAVRPLRILLAEDNPANQKVACHVLDLHGHSVETVVNGLEAIERLSKEDFDIVLMDVQMSVMDGLEATAAIRALTDPIKARIPIVAMTAFAMQEDRERCLAAGMDGYLSKPIHANELIAMLQRLTDKEQESSENKTAIQAESNWTDERRPNTSTDNVFNLDEAVTRCFGKYDLFQDMVGCLFDESDSLLAEMNSAIAENNAAELSRAAHRLKGTVIFLSAPSAGTATQRVEQIGMSGDLSEVADAIDQLQNQIAILKNAVAPHRKLSN